MLTPEQLTELAADVDPHCAVHTVPTEDFVALLAIATEALPPIDVGAATLDQQLMVCGVKEALARGYATDQALTHWARTGLRARADARIARRARELVQWLDAQSPGWRDALEKERAPVFDTFRALLAAVLAADATKGVG